MTEPDPLISATMTTAPNVPHANVQPRSEKSMTQPNGVIGRLADAFAYSSGLAAAVGATLTYVASRALGATAASRWVMLVGVGTFIIYNLDRLRDLERDGATSPHRTAFVLRNRRTLYAGVIAASIGLMALLWTTPAPMVGLTLFVGLVGLFHRRIKSQPARKAFYVSGCWAIACVGLPWLASRQDPLGLWVLGILFASVAANLMASNLRDNEVVHFMRGDNGAKRVLWLARGLLSLAILAAAVGPSQWLGLVWIPFCEGLALARFRPAERYGHLAVDGGLLVGALFTSLHFACQSVK